MLHIMGTQIKDWLSKNSLGVSGYSACSLVLLQSDATTKLAKLMSNIGYINTILAMAIAIITLTIKVIELVRVAKKKEKEEKE